jgi:hypothetical protein
VGERVHALLISKLLVDRFQFIRRLSFVSATKAATQLAQPQESVQRVCTADYLYLGKPDSDAQSDSEDSAAVSLIVMRTSH